MTEYRALYQPFRAAYLKAHTKEILEAFHKTQEYLAYQERQAVNKKAKAAEKKEVRAKNIKNVKVETREAEVMVA